MARQKPTDWTAQALIGRTVENDQGDNLGDINNVILNEKGDVVAVTIGVGGFLGIGEKNVGVPFEALDFRVDDRRTDMGTTEREDTQRDDTPRDDARRDDASATKREMDTDRNARFDTEHNNISIVLNASKEQLEAAPAFVWLDDADRRQPLAKSAPFSRSLCIAGWVATPSLRFHIAYRNICCS